MKKRFIFSLLVVFYINVLAVSGVDFYVSPVGSDSQAGTIDLPFATIVRAQQAVKAAVAEGVSREVNVYIRGGVYYLPEGLNFAPSDGGSESCMVSYCGYAQEMPHLFGGQRLTGRGRKIAVDGCRQDSELFADGQRVVKARLPESGYFEMGKPLPGNGKLSFEFLPDDIAPEGWDVSCGEINYWPVENWFNINCKLSSIDISSNKIIVDTPEREIRAGNRYYLYNIPQLLKSGSCVVNWLAGEVLYIPEDEQEPSELVLSTAANLIELKGSDKALVRNLHFKCLDLSIARNNIFDISFAEGCSISGCLIANAASTGVYIHRQTQEIAVTDNEIRYNGLHGIGLQGWGRTSSSNCHRHMVNNNHIYNCGRLLGHGNGVYTGHSGYNHIVHNHIHDMPRYGITVKGERYKTIEGKVPGMSWENRYDFMPARNNYIAFNDIHHVNQDSQDTGAIESWGPGRDNVIHCNLIHDSGNDQFSLQSGIYLDDQADYWTVTDNIIYNIAGSRQNQCIYAKGIGNRIENNILIGSKLCTAGIKSFYMADERCDHHVYRHNIFYFALDKPDGVYAYDFVNYFPGRLSDCDNNIMYATAGEVATVGSPAGTDYNKWLELEGGRFDQHSLRVDPCFADPANHDYTLLPNSPAFELGIHQVDVDSIGLTDEYPGWLGR